MSGPTSNCTYCNEGVKLWDDTIRYEGEVFCGESCKCAYIGHQEYDRIIKERGNDANNISK